MKKKLLLMLALVISATSFSQTVAIIGAFVNWTPANQIPMIQSSTDPNLFTLEYNFNGTTVMKFRANDSWGEAYGSSSNPSGFPSGTGIVTGSTDIAVPAGTYTMTFNIATKEYNFAGTPGFENVSITGAGVGGWGLDTDLLTTDGITYTIQNKTIATTPQGNPPTPSSDVKFRVHNFWDIQWGNAAFPSGIADKKNGPDPSNIPATPGMYDITFNIVTREYSFLPAGTLAVTNFENKNFSVYPNPTSSNWNITSGKNDITAVKIVDVSGKTVYSSGKTNSNLSVDTSKLAKGVYFAKVSSATANETIKLMKN
jgi:starch-binding outer membrane protein SusE/F